MLTPLEAEKAKTSLFFNICTVVVLSASLTFVVLGLYFLFLYQTGCTETSCVIRRLDATTIYCQYGQTQCMTKREQDVHYLVGQLIQGSVQCYNPNYLDIGLISTLFNLGFIVCCLILRYYFYPRVEPDHCLLDEI